MVGHGGSSAGSYLADPTSPIPSHCASIVATSTVTPWHPSPLSYTPMDRNKLLHVPEIPYTYSITNLLSRQYLQLVYSDYDCSWSPLAYSEYYNNFSWWLVRQCLFERTMMSVRLGEQHVWKMLPLLVLSHQIELQNVQDTVTGLTDFLLL